MMERLLSPNEAKFWLLDQAAPCNSVVVLQRRGPPLLAEDAPGLALPAARRGRRDRPRWTAAAAPGVVRRRTAAEEAAWLPVAAELLDRRIGTENHPAYAAVVLDQPDGLSTLVLAVSHALTDYRSALHLAHCLADGLPPGDLAPPCEEMLPAHCFGAADAEALVEAWWGDRAGARWQALGSGRLTAVLPPAAPTRLALARLDGAETQRIEARCEAEGVTLNSALAMAVRDVTACEGAGLDGIAFSVDLGRFLRPALPDGPGMAISHIFTALAPGPFWEAARENRAASFAAIEAGEAGDALLVLPRLLLDPRLPPDYREARMTITGAPTWRPRAAGEETEMELVLSGARGGGAVLIPGRWRGRLQLLAAWPEGEAPVDPAALLARLLEAAGDA